MNTIRIALTLSLEILVMTFKATAQVPTSPPDTVVAVLIDDQTGEELARDHGIQPLAAADMDSLINSILRGRQPASLFHLAVSETSSDSPVARMEFKPYSGGEPPKAPSPTLPLRQLTAKMVSYKHDRTEWQRGILAYRKQVVSEAEGFVRQVTATQLKVAQRFDEILASRGGRDFNRSDIVGAITTANRLLVGYEHRYMVFNTDATDAPAKRKPRSTPLTAEELDPKIELIFVNTSRLPEQASLFMGIPNKKHHADSIQAAMGILVGNLNQRTEQRENDQPSPSTTKPSPAEAAR
jgi:hypothetical protein